MARCYFCKQSSVLICPNRLAERTARGPWLNFIWVFVSNSTGDNDNNNVFLGLRFSRFHRKSELLFYHNRVRFLTIQNGSLLRSDSRHPPLYQEVCTLNWNVRFFSLVWISVSFFCIRAVLHSRMHRTLPPSLPPPDLLALRSVLFKFCHACALWPTHFHIRVALC